MANDRQIAYFSMEIALEPAVPTYSGGLGILAGDTLRAAADQALPLLAVTLVHRKGYFRQRIDASGWQIEEPAPWPVEKFARELPARAVVQVEGRDIRLRAWEYTVKGIGEAVIPVYLLDTDLQENSEWDRHLTDELYGGDAWYRLCQEIVLGIGGVRMLRALGHNEIRRYHLNEGHAALIGLELLAEHARDAGRSDFNGDDVEAVRQHCVFTTHTPVPAGHDRYPLDLVGRALGRSDFGAHHDIFCCEGELNLTYLALNVSHYVNGVAKRHGEVAQRLLKPTDAWHHYHIDHITNGVHLATWASPPFADLFDRHVPGWREDNSSLRSALAIPEADIFAAHQKAKSALIEAVNNRTQAGFELDRFTIGFARRATAYKRAGLLLSDPTRLKEIAAEAGGLQVVYAGKAHPHDYEGKQIIRRILNSRALLQPEVHLVYLEDYNWELARLLTSGVDVWLNTPQPPLEASGTSGMKAALNGVPSFSVSDGWWIEGCVEEVTGWTIGTPLPVSEKLEPTGIDDAKSLYEKLEHVVLPTYRRQREEWGRIMRHAIALNASHFNTQRMILQYVLKAYFE